MTRLLAAVLLAAGLVGCAGTRPEAPAPLSPAAALVERAKRLTAEDRPAEAAKLYLDVLRKYPQDPAAFDARYGMARLRLDPDSPLRDYRLALINFDRLVARYGKSGGAWLEEVEAWRAALRTLERCEVQGAKLSHDVDRLRTLESNMDQLRGVDLELEVGK